MTSFSSHAQAVPSTLALHADSIANIASFIPVAAAALTIIALAALLYSIAMEGSVHVARRLIACLLFFGAFTGVSLVMNRLGILADLSHATSIADNIVSSVSIPALLLVGGILLLMAYGLFRQATAQRYTHAESNVQEVLHRAIECTEALLASLAQIPGLRGDADIGNTDVSVDYLRAALHTLIEMREGTPTGIRFDSDSRERLNTIVRMLNAYVPLHEEYLQMHRPSAGAKNRVAASRPGPRLVPTFSAHGRQRQLQELSAIPEQSTSLDLIQVLWIWSDGGSQSDNSPTEQGRPPQSLQSTYGGDCPASESGWTDTSNDGGSGSDGSNDSCNDSN